tara:strand:- start:662 stop:1540 length:879 start_codon:yes stop_codon:yes gene_type:complete
MIQVNNTEADMPRFPQHWNPMLIQDEKLKSKIICIQEEISEDFKNHRTFKEVEDYWENDGEYDLGWFSCTQEKYIWRYDGFEGGWDKDLDNIQWIQWAVQNHKNPWVLDESMSNQFYKFNSGGKNEDGKRVLDRFGDCQAEFRVPVKVACFWWRAFDGRRTIDSFMNKLKSDPVFAVEMSDFTRFVIQPPMIDSFFDEASDAIDDFVVWENGKQMNDFEGAMYRRRYRLYPTKHDEAIEKKIKYHIMERSYYCPLVHCHEVPFTLLNTKEIKEVVPMDYWRNYMEEIDAERD